MNRETTKGKAIATALMSGAAGVVVGLIIAIAVGLWVINLIIPWEDVCLVLGPAKTLAETGSALITELQAWLSAAENFLNATPAAESADAPTGLGSLLEKARDVAGGVGEGIVDVLTVPLRVLIDLAQAALSAVKAAVDAARDVISSVDSARCG